MNTVQDEIQAAQERLNRAQAAQDELQRAERQAEKDRQTIATERQRLRELRIQEAVILERLQRLRGDRGTTH